METFTFPQFSPERSVVHAALYTNVTNAGALRKRIISSRLHLQTAIYQAILAESQNALRTRTVHSEVLWALSPTNHITEALRRYGVSDSTTSVIVVGIEGASAEKMGAAVAGDLSPFAGLGTLTDWRAIKKYHKLHDVKGDAGAMDNIVVSMVAMKSVMG
ncbi:CGI-121-domain-containing protein [Lyophyllum atratum]|nr:CGI-121-domain-containing protein [Lyophyllum atratum]